MEEKMIDSDRPQRQKLAFIRHQIQEFADRSLKNCQTLKIITDQFKVKQSTKANFQKQQFSKSAYAHFVEINTFFQKVISQMTSFPILGKMASLLSTICLQYFHIFKFSNEKWECQYRLLEQLYKNKTVLPPFKSDMCLSCSENKWHQHIKSQKHQIFNLKIEDPFYYYKEAVVNQKEVSGEQIDHKKLQEKLSELAMGVQMEQNCLKQLLQSLNQQDSSAKNKLQEPNFAENQAISLPFMPMLRSVFHYTNRANRKATQQMAVQANLLPEKLAKIIETPQSNLNQLNVQKDKIQFKLITQLADKTVQIKELQLKIHQAEKIQADLKSQHNILIQQNITLQKRNSILEGQLSLSKLKSGNNKFKLANKKKSLQKTKQDISTAVNSKSFNNQAAYNQQLLGQKSFDQAVYGKIRGTAGHDSKFKAQQAPNKTMFIPNLYQNNLKVPRQSVTPGHHGSALSIERGSDKLEDQGLNSVVDFPSLRQSIHSIDPFHQKSHNVKFEEKKSDEKEIKQLKKQIDQRQQVNKSRRKLKQITKKFTNHEEAIVKELTRSQNHSPDLEQKNFRRVGKIQDRQSLLRMLYDSQVKECSDKSLNFDYFKKSYENFVLKIVGVEDSENEMPRMAKIKHLHKKSTVSIKQYYRNDFVESKDETINNKELENHQEKSKCYARFSTCFRDIMNNLFAEENQNPAANINQLNGKIILNNEELQVITQILAYMIQLKVNNLNAYTKIKTILSIQSGQRKKGSNFSEENKELKLSISGIIRNHRKCQCFEGHTYCKHISVFIRNIVALMEQ